MESSTTRLFVYGTLRKGFHHPAFEYLSKYFTFVSIAKVRGQLYDLGEYPAAIPAKEDLFVTGELYELNAASEFDWVIEQLDEYEGLNPEEGEKPLYRRDLVDVIYENHSGKAWIYWYNQSITGHPLIASGDIFHTMNNTNK
jgi:gamma-glutamylcyclotransferase (GGCT)/AIG2-like uncharacterized protein YtfP